MMLKFGIILDNDLHNIGQIPTLLHLDGLKAVKFSYVFTNAGLSCLSILMYPLVPKIFAIVVVMAFVLLAPKSECDNGKNFNNTGAFAI
jgi:hypothetical protein